MIYALDLGANFGYAFFKEGKIESGSYSLIEKGRISGGGMRYLNFKLWLCRNLKGKDVQEVRYEEVKNHTGVLAAHAFGGYQGILTSFCEENNIPFQSVPVGSIKKHATGKGNASKEFMIKAMQAKGHNPQCDNEADALALLYLTLEERKINAN